MSAVGEMKGVAQDAKGYVEHYDLFGYYKPALLLALIIAGIDAYYGQGIFPDAMGHLGDALNKLVSSSAVQDAMHAGTTADNILEASKVALPLPMAIVAAILVFFVAVASLYILGHVVHALSQLIEISFVQNPSGYPSNWYLSWFNEHRAEGAAARVKKRHTTSKQRQNAEDEQFNGKYQFKDWYYGKPWRVVFLQNIPLLSVLILLVIAAWKTPIAISDSVISYISLAALLPLIIAPNLHITHGGKLIRAKLYALISVLALYTIIFSFMILRPSLMTPTLLVWIELVLVSLFVVGAVLLRFLDRLKLEVLNQFIPSAYTYLLAVTSNHVFFLLNTFGMTSPIESPTMQCVLADYRARYSMSDDQQPTSSGLWWHCYLTVMKKLPEAHKAIYHWLSLYGFARSLSAAFYLAAFYYVVHPLLFSDAKPFHLAFFVGLLLLSYLFFYRFLYLFTKYYTRYTIRAAAYAMSGNASLQIRDPKLEVELFCRSSALPQRINGGPSVKIDGKIASE